jgi:hypothetical protein
MSGVRTTPRRHHSRGMSMAATSEVGGPMSAYLSGVAREGV